MGVCVWGGGESRKGYPPLNQIIKSVDMACKKDMFKGEGGVNKGQKSQKLFWGGGGVQRFHG